MENRRVTNYAKRNSPGGVDLSQIQFFESSSAKMFKNQILKHSNLPSLMSPLPHLSYASETTDRQKLQFSPLQKR